MVLGRTRVAVFSSLVALLVPTVAVILLGADTVIRVKDSGAIPSGLPLPQIPTLAALDGRVIAGAAAVAALVLIQGAGVAEAVPNPDGSTSSTRRDFTAQGVGNLASGFFGGQPVGGSVGQTALNVAAGRPVQMGGHQQRAVDDRHPARVLDAGRRGGRCRPSPPSSCTPGGERSIRARSWPSPGRA